MLTQRHMGFYCAYKLILFTVLLLFSEPALAHLDRDIDLWEYVSEADFIFKGRVINIAYRNSEGEPLLDPNTGGPLLDPNGNPIYEGGTNIPHTFVTYQIEEVYKGRAPQTFPGGPPDSNVTLRFMGGQSQTNTSDYLMVSNIPLFDVSDRDILFVNGNTEESCPLIDWFAGRFRILRDPNDPDGRLEFKIFNELGLEVIYVPAGDGIPEYVTYGPYHSLEEINDHRMGEFILRRVTVDDGNEFDVNDVPNADVRLGKQFTDKQFKSYLSAIVLELCGLPPSEDCLVQVENADINQSFTAERFPVFRPVISTEEPAPYPRPWLDKLPPEEREEILEAERQEHEMLQLSRGNPVLPKSPCEIAILRYGAIAGDVSGPRGKPDCQVDFFDVAALAKYWLGSFEPGIALQPLCIE